MKFDTLSDYLDALRADASLSVIPVSLVADHLQITPAAVSARIRAGTLEGARIGGAPFVLLKSLIEERKRFDELVLAVRTALEKRARGRISVVFYEDIMTPIGLQTTVPAHRLLIGRILGKISEQTNEEGKGLLSVLVHRKTQGTTRPGPGFFELARFLGYEFGDEDAFVAQQTRKVLSKYKPRT